MHVMYMHMCPSILILYVARHACTYCTHLFSVEVFHLLQVVQLLSNESRIIHVHVHGIDVPVNYCMHVQCMYMYECFICTWYVHVQCLYNVYIYICLQSPSNQSFYR